jgi:hypothetical protein
MEGQHMKVRESGIPPVEKWHAFFALHVKVCQTVYREDHIEDWRAKRYAVETGNESWK